MPTVPEPHEVRQVAESFGANAERYDRARPSYPTALIERLANGRDVLDVGCGTGIVARQLQAAGCHVLGVDVDERMAETARRSGLEVEVAKFEAWDPGRRTFDTVVAGQSWHWIDPVAGAAKAAQILRPGGRLAVFWNVFQAPPDVGAAFDEVYRRLLPDFLIVSWAKRTLDAYEAFFDKTSDGIRQAGTFGRPEEWTFDWLREYNRNEWLDQLPTFGGHNRLPSAQLQQLLAAIGDAVDAVGGRFTMGYTTVAVIATRE
jgi:SAM-dependent methyltransferase